MSSTPTLLDLGPDAYSHQAEVNEVKRRLGIDHSYFDCWFFGFLENKNFKINDTVAKLQRREEFERTQLGEAEITDWMMENMQKGIIQVIGNDKEGRVTFYICTARDKPSSSRREESRKNFDMFISYGTRLRPESKRCQMAMLINQDKASFWSNLDMTFQADIALRIAKFYPGCVDKMYICKMGRALSAVAKPIFSRLPSIVSERIIIISDGDIKGGKLLQLYDEDVLPVTFGGKNDCDKQENYTRFAYTIKEYFEQLKAAVQRGSSVKEWELENLKAAGHAEGNSRMDVLKRSYIDPMGSQLAPGGSFSGAAGRSMSDLNRSWSAASMGGRGGADCEDNLLTCDSVTLDMYRRPSSAAQGGTNHSSQHVQRYLNDIPRDLFTDYVSQFNMIEGFFRINVMDMYEREWLGMLQREVEERQYIIRMEDQFQTESLFRSLPPALHLIVKGFLWLCMMVMSSYFFLGTMFIALLGVVTLIFIFFAMFSHTYNVFLYGAAFVVTGVQFAIFCSRGFDLTRNTFNGRLVQAFKAFGSKALIFQLVVYVIGTLGYFVLFCVMAHRHDVLTGIQYSTAYGFIVAVCITVIYHFAFAFGFKEINKTSYRHGSRINNAETTLYLFMDVELDDDSGRAQSMAEIVLLTLVGLLIFAFGVAYMTEDGRGVFFLGATVVLLSLLLVLCTAFMFSSNAGSSSSVTFVAVFYACVFWANAVFTMTMYGWHDGWGGSLLTVLFVMLFFCITCFVSMYGPWRGVVRRWFFRVAWGLITLHVLGCIIGLFVYNWRMGLFVMALTVHLLVCCFRTNEASNTYGVFTIVCGFSIALLTCCLLGHYAVAELYDTSVSDSLLPAYNGSVYMQATHLLLDSHQSILPPLCHLRFPTQDLGIVGMALFAKIGYNTDPASQAADLQHWFPGFTRVPDVSSGDATLGQLIEATVFRREASDYNTTIVTVRTGSNVQRVIEAMTMWIDQYCVSFFGFLMPAIYFERIMPYISFMEGMVPPQVRGLVDASMIDLVEHISQLQGSKEFTYVVAHGASGATAAVAILRSGLPVTTVAFATPEVLRSRNKLGISEEDLTDRLVTIRTTPSVYNAWYLHSPRDQVIPCDGGGKWCDKLDTTINTLDRLCRP